MLFAYLSKKYEGEPKRQGVPRWRERELLFKFKNIHIFPNMLKSLGQKQNHNSQNKSVTTSPTTSYDPVLGNSWNVSERIRP